MAKKTDDLSIRIYEQPIAYKYTVYINDVVEPDFFNDLFYKLQNSSENDIFEININSFGGNEDTAIQMYNEIVTSDANVVGCVSGYCCSAGTIALLACDNWSITKTSKIMIHSPSGFMMGKYNETKAQSHFDDQWTKDFFKTVYKNFLTDKEIQEVLDGKDFWLTGEETVERLKKFVKARK